MAVVGPSDFFVNKRFEILRGTTYTGVTAYIGLITVGPTSSDMSSGVTELVHADYARKACGFSAAASRSMQNGGTITFIALSTGAWNSGAAIKRFGIWDNATAGLGNLLWVDEILPVLTVAAMNTPVVIQPGTLILRSDTRTVAD